jgi:hypothetical protein
MDKLELEKLLQDIQELKRSVRRANPFLREIMELRAYWIMSIPLGILLLADCLLMHFLVRASGSFGAIPSGWKIASLALFIAILAIGSVWKWIVINRRAAQLRRGATILTVIKAIYGGDWFGFSAPLILCLVVTSAFFLWSGRPWLIFSIVAIFIGTFCNIVGKLLERREYLFMGWYMTLAGLASLFFIESMPFIWLAIVWAGSFLVFGSAGLIAGRAERGTLP